VIAGRETNLNLVSRSELADNAAVDRYAICACLIAPRERPSFNDQQTLTRRGHRSILPPV
jgi:hypothetical protein